MTKNSFIFYRSFFEALEPLNDSEKLSLLNAIAEYALNQTETELEPLAKAMFTLIKPQLEANNKRFENGTKGGRPKTKTKPKDNQTKTKVEPNVNKNDNVNANVNVNAIERDTTLPKADEVIQKVKNLTLESEVIKTQIEKMACRGKILTLPLPEEFENWKTKLILDKCLDGRGKLINDIGLWFEYIMTLKQQDYVRSKAKYKPTKSPPKDTTTQNFELYEIDLPK